MKKTAILFRYEWVNLLNRLPDMAERYKVFNALVEHDKKTADELTPEECQRELEQFDNDGSKVVYRYLVDEVDKSYNRYFSKGRW